MSEPRNEPSRAEIDARTDLAMLEFGASWCGICAAAQPSIGTALDAHRSVTHLKIEDGSGRPLGRSFGVKLWPTLVFLAQGREVERIVRPRSAAQIVTALERLETVGNQALRQTTG